MAERSVAEPDRIAPPQTTVPMNADPINPQVVFLIFVLTCSSWYPYVKQVSVIQQENYVQI